MIVIEFSMNKVDYWGDYQERKRVFCTKVGKALTPTKGVDHSLNIYHLVMDAKTFQ